MKIKLRKEVHPAIVILIMAIITPIILVASISVHIGEIVTRLYQYTRRCI